MNVIEEMAQSRERLVYGEDTPVWTEYNLLRFMAQQLMSELRKSGSVPDPETTRAIAAYQTWVASQG